MEAHLAVADRPSIGRIAGEHSRSVYGLLVLAEALVLLLGWQSSRAHDRQRRLLERNLAEFAKFGATNFAYRTGALLANHAQMASAGIARVRGPSDAARVARARSMFDSLAACRCELALTVRTVMLVDDEGRVLASAPASTTTVPAAVADLQARAATLERPVLALRSAGETRAPLVMALARVGPAGPGRRQFLLSVYDVDSLRARVFDFIYRTRPPLLPSVFGAQRSNDAIIDVRVVLPGGGVLYESNSDARWPSMAVVPLGVDTGVTVQAALTEAAAHEVTGRVDEGLGRWWDLFATLTATVAIGMIAVLVRRAAALGKLRGDFTAAVSHELRTPLTEIILYAELLLTGRAAGTGRTADAARVILAEARRLHHLVENVLIVARTDRRMLRVRLGAHALSPLVRTTIAGFEPIAAKRRVRVSLEATDLPDVRCDPSAVAGLLLNLLDNAVRYGPEAQSVIVRVTRHAPRHAALEVDDAGPGIPVADRQRVLDPYVRLDRDVEAGASGSGLGLAVVLALLVEMDGTLTILHSARGGTLVRATLPFC